MIKDSGLLFHKEVFLMLGIGHQTYHNHKLNKDQEIQQALNDNRVLTKVGLRNKMFNSEHPTSWIALYKLLADPDELARLNNETLLPPAPDSLKIEVVGVSKEEASKLQEDITAITQGNIIEVNEKGDVVDADK